VWRATWKGLLGHKLRFILTGVAITLGVGLVAASFIFTDSLGRAFDDIFAGSLGAFDVQVRPAVDDDLVFVQGEPIDESVVDEIRAVEGVTGVQGSLFGFTQLVINGELVEGGGPPTFVVSWPEMLPDFVVKSGERPQGDHELSLDALTARRFEVEPGALVELIGVGSPEEFTVSGTAGLKDIDTFAGAATAYVPLPTAQRLLGLAGKVLTVEISAEEGTQLDQLIPRVQAILPSGVEAVSAQSAAQEQLATFKQALGFLNTFLLVFGGVTVFVAAFLIQNTFRIIVAQRTRELALLRAVGASRRQVVGMVVGEATMIGIIAAGLGLGVGVLLAHGIRALLSFGGALPSAPLQLPARTVLIAVAVGVAVTIGSALLPARAAARVPPVAALRQIEAPVTSRSFRTRTAVGLALTGLGLGALAVGLLVDIGTERIPEIALVGAGAGLIFIGVAVLAAVVARPVTAFIGLPLRVAGVPGRLATENAGRSPRRTAATASALMVGLALVSLTLVMADSVKATADRLLDERFSADLVVGPSGFGGSRLSPEIADRLASVPEIKVAARLRGGQVEVENDTKFLAGADPALITQVLDFEVTDGALSDLGSGKVAVRSRVAEELALEVGDVVPVVFARTGLQNLTLVAIWEAEGVGAGLLVDLDTYRANFTEGFDDQIFLRLADGVSIESGRAAAEAVVAEFAGAEVSDESDFKQQAASQIDQLVRLIFGLLGVAVVIGFFGITNTLSLSVFERTREIGLLRALGMSRGQLRRSIAWESALIAAFGALLGVTLGIFFGWAVVSALERDALVLSIPVGRLFISTGVAVLAGVAAAALPAWRASRWNILEAIAYE
jgi:putative ABC transport system permease protein